MVSFFVSIGESTEVYLNLLTSFPGITPLCARRVYKF